MTTVQDASAQPTRNLTRWGPERRLEFIDFRLAWDGKFNRGDLTRFFGISVPRASLDVSRYKELAPGNLSYDARSRVYVRAVGFRPLFASSGANRYLNELLAGASGVLDAEASFIGWRPPVAHVPQPDRRLDAGVLATLLWAIREHACIEVVYQSLQRAEPGTRTLSVHALAHDGFRWHVRAYCHERGEYRDFVIARMTDIRTSAATWIDGAADRDWHSAIDLVLAPNPKLPKAHQRAIELDFGMSEGQTVLRCRKALVFYALRRLGLQPDDAGPEVRQLVLKNRRQLAAQLPVAAVS